MASKDKKIAQHLNFVHNDQIWKDHVRHETMSQRFRWPAKWGYLVHEYESLSCQLRGQPTPVCRPRTPYSPYRNNKLPPINKPKGRQLDFPVTTTQQIGWKVTKPEDQLEIYGPDSRGQCGILRLLRWPQESAP
ncbi:uncharacterized protein C20orf85 homolog [Ylistrum balloti]|uniref:uncharacterized protein C20orf85 homolog n=1 Tax=Ylistrum balloti TaxID=509963 RepID=UPI0029059990|nr:uncharacterized protein C20orf85 homolog [Ylistrum balloti]